MMRRRVLVACLAITACGGASRSAPTTNAGSAEGVYEYSASVPYQVGTTIRVHGTLSVVGDSLFVQPDSGCFLYRPAVGQAPIRPGAATLTCGGASLKFDRRNLKSGTWYSVVQVPKQRNVCAQYEPRDAARSPRCLRWRPETYYESQRRTGVVQVRLIQ
jgi:hypothetical protein